MIIGDFKLRPAAFLPPHGREIALGIVTRMGHEMEKTLMAILGVLVLTGCVTTAPQVLYVKPGANHEEFQRTLAGVEFKAQWCQKRKAGRWGGTVPNRNNDADS
jgi:starvation-inducible outer membrane lipoprotein